MSTSDTPRTDAFLDSLPLEGMVGPEDAFHETRKFARQPERELATAQEHANELAHEVGQHRADYIRLEKREARLRDALEPFAEYALKHGASNLNGRNGARIEASAWLNAAALAGSAQPSAPEIERYRKINLDALAWSEWIKTQPDPARVDLQTLWHAGCAHGRTSLCEELKALVPEAPLEATSPDPWSEVRRHVQSLLSLYGES